MPSTVATHSRIASLTASFNVALPTHRHDLGAEQPHAPHVQRLALDVDRPMYTVQSRPNNAAPVAVATPC